MMSSISLFNIISVVIGEHKIFSADDAAGVNSNGIKTLLANRLHFSLVVTLFLIMDHEVYQEILLIVLF